MQINHHGWLNEAKVFEATSSVQPGENRESALLHFPEEWLTSRGITGLCEKVCCGLIFALSAVCWLHCSSESGWNLNILYLWDVEWYDTIVYSIVAHIINRIHSFCTCKHTHTHTSGRHYLCSFKGHFLLFKESTFKCNCVDFEHCPIKREHSVLRSCFSLWTEHFWNLHFFF